MANHPTEIPVQYVESSSKVEPFISRIVPDAAPDGTDPDHHLWRNGRLWWIAFTVHRGCLQERVRFSLGTDDVAEARRKRDLIFALYASAADCKISLRFAPRGRRHGARRAHTRRTRCEAAREMQQ